MYNFSDLKKDAFSTSIHQNNVGKELENAEANFLFKGQNRAVKSIALDLLRVKGESLSDFDFGDDEDETTIGEKWFEKLKSFYAQKSLTQKEARAAFSLMGFPVARALSCAYDLIFEEYGRKRLEKNKKLMARCVAYLFSVLSYNCSGTDFKITMQYLNDSRFAEAFDEDAEIMDGHWIIPITGSLYDDLRANYIAKQVMNMDYEDAESLARGIFVSILDQFREWMLSGCATKFSLPFDPYRDEDDVNMFLDHFDDAYVSKLQKDAYNNDTVQELSKKVVSRQLQLSNYRFIPTLAANITMDYCNNVLAGQTYIPFSCAVSSNAMGHPDKTPNCASLLGSLQRVDEAIFDRISRQRKHIDLTPAEELIKEGDFDMDAMFEARQLKYRASMLDRERLDLHRRKAALKEQKKGIFLTKRQYKEMTELQEELDKKDEEIKALRAQLQNAKDSVSAAKNRYENQTKRITALEERTKAAEQELSRALSAEEAASVQSGELQKQVEWLQKRMESMDPAAIHEEELDTSVFDNLNVVCVGGHLSWSAKMKGFHKNIHIYDRDDPSPTDNVLREADVIWLQNNCLSHPEYYRVIDIAKTNNIPIKFFNYAGHVRCKQQIVQETQAMLKAAAASN